MGVDQSGTKKRKKTGGRTRRLRGKRRYELGSSPTHTAIGKEKRVVKKQLGGTRKHRLRGAENANVYDPTAKKHKVVPIKTVVKNPSNREFARRNILTKGTIIDTELGRARVTSRPGQHGVVNAVLTEAAKEKPVKIEPKVEPKPEPKPEAVEEPKAEEKTE